MEESFLLYKFPPWTAEQEYPQDAQDKLKKELSFSNNFTFDLLNLCRILNLSPHPDLINLKSKEEITKLQEQQIEPAALSPRPGTTKSAKAPSKPAKAKALTVDDYIERGIYKIEDIYSLSIQKHLLDSTTVKLLTMTLPQSFIQNLTISGVHLTKESLHELSSCLQQYPFIRVLKIEWNPVNVYHSGKTPRPPTPVVEEKKEEEKKEEEKKEETSKKSEKKSMKEDKSKSKIKKDDKKSVKKGKGKKGKEEEKKEEEEEEKKEELPPPPPPEPPKPRHSFDSFFDAEDINNIPPKEGEEAVNPTPTTTTTDVNGNSIEQPTEAKTEESKKEEEKKEKEEEYDAEKYMDDYSEIFAEFVDAMSPVEYLCLRGNKITSKGFKAICEKLKSCITITELNLFDNLIDDEGIEILSEMIKYNRSLYSLSLSHNRIIGSNLSKILSSFVPYSVEQKEEKANRDKVISDTKNAYKELGGLLKKRKAMLTSAKKPELDIAIPKMPDLGSVGKKDNMCPGNDTLHVIDLSYNKVSDENVKIFVDNLKDCFNHNSEVLPISLENLILSENGLNEESLIMLEEGLKYVPESNDNVDNNTNVSNKKGKSPRSPKG